MSKSPKYRMVPPMRTGEPPLIGRAKVDVSIRLSDKDVFIAELLEALKQATDELDGYIIDQEAQLEGHPEYKRRHLYETQRVRDNLCAAIAKAENVGEAP